MANKILTGQEARDYKAKNPKKGYNVLDANGNVVSSKAEDRGLVGGIAYGIASPFLNTVKAAGELNEARKTGNTNSNKFLDRATFEKAKKNPALFGVKQAAGIASTFIPGGVGAKGLLAAGALAGFGGSEADDIGGLLKDTAMGAGTGLAAGKALQYGGKALKGIQGGKVGQKVGNYLKKSGLEKQKAGLKTKVDASLGGFENMAANEDIAFNTIKRYGVDPRNKPKALEETAKRLGKDLDAAYADHSQKVGKFLSSNNAVSEIGDDVLKPLAFDLKMTPDDLRNQMRDWLSSFGTAEKSLTGALKNSAKLDANDIRKVIQRTRGAVEKEAMGKRLTPSESLDKIIHNKLSDILETEPALEGLKSMNREFAALYEAAPATIRERIKNQTINLPFTGSAIGNAMQPEIPVRNMLNDAKVGLGVKMENLGNRLVNGKSAVAGQPGKFAKVGQGIKKGASAIKNSRFTPLAAAYGISPMLKGGGMQMAEDPSMMEAEMNGSSPEELGSIQDGGGIDFTQAKQDYIAQRQGVAQQLVQSDPKISFSQALKEADAYMETMGIDNPILAEKEARKAVGGGKKLSGEDRKLRSNVRSGLRALDTIEGSLADGSGELFSSNLPGFLQSGGTKRYGAALDEVSDVIGRLRSGGAVSEGEEARFKRLLPKTFDDEETAAYKINAIRQLLQEALVTDDSIDAELY